MAAMELRRVRIQFVENVSGNMVKQLLDDLFDKGVLNRGEKDSILENNNARDDRARALADTVMAKGDEASVILIDSIRTRDPHLSKTLGLAFG